MYAVWKLVTTDSSDISYVLYVNRLPAFGHFQPALDSG